MRVQRIEFKHEKIAFRIPIFLIYMIWLSGPTSPHLGIRSLGKAKRCLWSVFKSLKRQWKYTLKYFTFKVQLWKKLLCSWKLVFHCQWISQNIAIEFASTLLSFLKALTDSKTQTITVVKLFFVLWNVMKKNVKQTQWMIIKQNIIKLSYIGPEIEQCQQPTSPPQGPCHIELFIKITP